MNTQAPAGWYPQPDGTQRYWDGNAWTEHIAPGAGAAQAAATSTAATPSAVVPEAPTPGSDAPVGVAANARPWWKKKRFIIPGAAVAAVIGISAIANGGGDGDALADDTPPAVTSETPSPSEEPSESAAPTTFTMPDVVGMTLQDAQDTLQGLGSVLMDQTDASGQDRMQVDDSNWQVCSQEPAPGTEAPVETVVTLSSVKLGESCDGSAEVDDSDLTTAQKEALESAQGYLAYTAFSKKGLKDQLEFEGYEAADIDAAMALLDVDWNEQAALKAAEYLDFSAFSKSGLIDQLKFEGFTSDQAKAGVAANDVNWNEQAAKKALEYLDSMSFSKSELIDQLEFEGFSHDQAVYGVKEAGL